MLVKKYYFKWDISLEVDGLKLHQEIDNAYLHQNGFYLKDSKNDIDFYQNNHRKWTQIKIRNGKIVGFFIRDKFEIEGQNILNEILNQSLYNFITLNFEQVEEKPLQNSMVIITGDGFTRVIAINA